LKEGLEKTYEWYVNKSLNLNTKKDKNVEKSNKTF